MAIPLAPRRLAPGIRTAGRRRTELELDHAFLHWFEERLAQSGPEPREDVVLDYWDGWALRACCCASLT
jgi:hypothetical protein